MVAKNGGLNKKEMIGMGLKIFEMIGRLPQKTVVFKIFRLSRGSEICDSEASSYSCENQVQTSKSLNPQAYLLAKQRMYEIETQKAMTIVSSRHERWKAGGPL